MRIIDTFRRSGRSLGRAKLRTLLTMLSISIGAFALMIALAAGEGARHFVDRLISTNINDHSMFVFRLQDNQQPEDLFASSDNVQEYTGPTVEGVESGQQALKPADIEKINSINDVERAVPLVYPELEYVTAEGAKKYKSQLVSIDEGIRYELLAGTLGDKGTTLPEKSVVLPEAMVKPLGFTSPEKAIGKQITVQFAPAMSGMLPAESFTVAAVAKKPSGLLGGARELIFAQSTLERIYAQQIGQANVAYPTAILYVKDNSEQTIQKVTGALAAAGYQSLSAKEVAQQVTQAVNIVQYFIAGFGIIAIIVSVFGIVNTQLISVLERTRQIGLMKALGLSGRGVLSLFTFEAMWIGLGGSLIGIFSAFVVSIFANPFIDDKLQIGGDLLVFVPGQVATLVGALVVIAAISGLLPAWKAARLNPITALRTE